MFNPLKGMGELNELRKQAMQLQNALKQIVIFEEKGRASVEMTADMKIKSVKVSGEEMNDLRDCLNDAIEKSQKKAARVSLKFKRDRVAIRIRKRRTDNTSFGSSLKTIFYPPGRVKIPLAFLPGCPGIFG